MYWVVQWLVSFTITKEDMLGVHKSSILQTCRYQVVRYCRKIKMQTLADLVPYFGQLEVASNAGL